MTSNDRGNLSLKLSIRRRCQRHQHSQSQESVRHVVARQRFQLNGMEGKFVKASRAAPHLTKLRHKCVPDAKLRSNLSLKYCSSHSFRRFQFLTCIILESFCIFQVNGPDLIWLPTVEKRWRLSSPAHFEDVKNEYRRSAMTTGTERRQLYFSPEARSCSTCCHQFVSLYLRNLPE